MPIQIIDNFNLGADKPIDNRLVVGPNQFYTDKDDIDNKYIGLRIWDINDDSSYIWKGTAWELETSGTGTGTVGPGTTSYIPKFTSSTTIGDSIISESSGEISINGILSSTYIKGIGSEITQLNASSISQGVLSLGRLQGDTNEVIIGQGIGNSSSWSNLDNLTIGNSDKINLSSSTDSDFNYLTIGKNPTTSQNLYTSDLLKYQPSTGRLTVNGSLSIGTDSEPPASGLLVSGSVKMIGLTQTDYSPISQRFVVTTDSTSKLELDNGTTVPPGGIIMWSEETLPSGFVICDGSTYVSSLFPAPNGIRTPDLRNRFPIGVGNQSTPNIELNTTGDINSASTGDPFTYYGIYFIIYVGHSATLV